MKKNQSTKKVSQKSKTSKKSNVKELSYKQKLRQVIINKVRGDVSTIAEITGYHRDHVSHVLGSRRKTESVVNAAYRLVVEGRGKA